MQRHFYTRRVPDNLMEELVITLLGAKTFEFRALFLIVYASLKEKKMSNGGEEMLRLRTYEKLQTLVRDGCATKTDGRYQGIRDKLLLLSEQLKERKRPFVPGEGSPETKESATKEETPPSV